MRLLSSLFGWKTNGPTKKQLAGIEKTIMPGKIVAHGSTPESLDVAKARLGILSETVTGRHEVIKHQHLYSAANQTSDKLWTAESNVHESREGKPYQIVVKEQQEPEFSFFWVIVRRIWILLLIGAAWFLFKNPEPISDQKVTGEMITQILDN